MNQRAALLCLVTIVATCVGCTKTRARDASAKIVSKRAPRIGFHLSDADPEKPEARTAVRGEPLSPEATRALLDRLPAPTASAEVAEGVSLRAGSLPAPRPGRTVSEAFPPPPAPPPAVAPGELTVTRHAPDGDVQHAPNLSVTFSQPMVELTTLDALAAKAPPLTLTPKPEGSFRWLGTQTLVFQPDKEFPRSTEYTVDVPAGTAGLGGAKTTKAEHFTFRTPTVHLVDYTRGDQIGLTPVLVAELDQRIDTAKWLAAAVVRVDEEPADGRGRQREMRLATTAEILAQRGLHEHLESIEKKGKDRILAFTPKFPLPPAAHVHVSFPAGLPSLEGPRLTDAEQSFSFQTYQKLQVTGGECTDCRPSSALPVYFNNELDGSAFDPARVVVEPPVDRVRVTVQGNSVLVRGHFKAHTHYTVKVPASLQDRFGQTLGAEESRGYDVLPFDPALFGGNKPMSVADPASLANAKDDPKPAYSIYSTNLPPMRVRLFRVGPEQWEQYLSFRNQWTDRQYSEKFKSMPTPPGTLVVDRVLDASTVVDEVNETLVDLGPALRHDVGQVLVVLEPRTWSHETVRLSLQEWVQVTRIGISSFESRDGGLSLLATTLAKADPMSGVSFSVLGTGLAATTGPAGDARIGGPVPQLDPNGILVARQGDDVAFVPGLYGGSSEGAPSPQLYTFDDRELYKPGETVRVKGLLRVVGSRSGGEISLPAGYAGRTVTYEVRDARWAQIGKGSAVLDDAGGLLVELKLPDNANLGPAHVDFMLGQEPVGSEPFKIQEFRRPEFEVVAGTEGGPFVVGESGVATVKGTYYAGGGLAAADTDWTVSASPGSFTPPNRAEYKFGDRSQSWSFWNAAPQGPRQATWKGRTDPSGTHRLRVDFDGVGDGYPMVLGLAGDLHDVNAQTWAAHTTMLVHPARIYVGLKPEKPFVQAGDALSFDVITTDLDGALVAGRHVHLRSHRSELVQVKGEWTEREVDVAECDFTTKNEAAPRACALGTREPGRYDVVAEVTDEQGRLSRTAVSAWVLGAGHGAERFLGFGRVEVELDKPTYAAGDHAEILVRSPFAPAQGRLEIVGGATPRVQRFTMTEHTTTLSLPIDAADEPGLTLRISLVGAQARLDEHGEVDPKSPPQPAMGETQVQLVIPPVDHDLHVTVKPAAANVRPGADTSVALEVTGKPEGAVEATVYVVDESVLALTGYTLRDPKDALYRQGGSLATSRDSRAYVQLARADRLNGPFAQNERSNGPSAPWGREDSFGAGGLGLTGMGDGGGGRGEGIGLGNIGTLGHGAGTGTGQGFGSGHGALRAKASAPAEPSPMSAFATRSFAVEDLPYNALLNMPKRIAVGTAENKPEPTSGPAITLRSNFDALAYFAARVPVDASGHAVVSFKLPDSTSRFRVMAVAWDRARAFGSGESTVTTRQPLMVRPSAPRFLNYGDKLELPIVVQNQSDAKLQVSIAARPSNATLVDPNGRTFSVDAGDRVEVRLPAAAAMPGQAHFDIAVAAGDFTDAAHVELPVYTPGTTEAFATYGNLGDEKVESVAQAITLPDGIDKHFGGLDVSTSSTSLFALSDAVVNLERYPFECNEQLASRILAVASLRDVMSAFAGPHTATPEQRAVSMAKDLRLLKGRQDSNGGFGFWVHDPWPYLTVHVGFALGVAQEKGYAVDPVMLARTRDYLMHVRDFIPANYGPEARRTIRAFALFVLRRLGAPNPAEARSLVEEKPLEETSLELLAWLLPTLHADPASQAVAASIARHFENRATETAGAAHFTTSYGESDYLLLASDHRTDALVLAALIETDPKNPLVAKVVAGLLGSRKQGHWQSTQEDAFVMLALDAYFRKFEKTPPAFTARAWLGEQLASDHTFHGYNVDRVESTVPMAQLGNGGALVVQKDGPGRLYYRLGLRYAPTETRLPPLERGFSVTRRYEAAGKDDVVTRDDHGVWHAKLGSLVRVHVSMVAVSERHHVALVDPLPAGFEVVNSSLVGASTVPTAPDDAAAQPRSWWYGTWYEHENLRDERAEAFTTWLRAGAYEYVYVTRATTPGTFVVPPAKAEEMYAPETFGRTGGDQLIVE